jgi:hypothetical protein
MYIKTEDLSLSKEAVENMIGYEIDSFSSDPVYLDNILVGVSIKVRPKVSVENIVLNFKIENEKS